MHEIHEHQVPALALAAIIDKLALECQQALPRHCEALGTAGVRLALADGIEAAQGHGVDFEDGWRAYIRLMFLFDREFDQRLPWARESLAVSEGGTGPERINALIVAARTEIQRRRVARKAES